MKRLIIGFIALPLLVLQLNSCRDGQIYKQGQIYYQNFCANCHAEDGKGLRGLIPPLAQSDYMEKQRAALPCIIRQGLNGAIVVNGVAYESQNMPGNDRLTDFEITNLLNYIGTAWGNNAPIWTVDEVRSALNSCGEH